jgi:hypothetical protein
MSSPPALLLNWVDMRLGGLMFSTNGESFRLRDFSAKGQGPVRELMQQGPQRTASTIRDLASCAGNYSIDVAERPLSATISGTTRRCA